MCRRYEEWIRDRLRKGFYNDLQQGLLAEKEVNEILKQRDIFNKRRKTIESQYYGKVVGIVSGKLFVGDSIHEVLAAAKRDFPSKPVYFEPIGFDILQ